MIDKRANGSGVSGLAAPVVEMRNPPFARLFLALVSAAQMSDHTC
jgi:hypothetical protein